jgi:hypothetical protein
MRATTPPQPSYTRWIPGSRKSAPDGRPARARERSTIYHNLILWSAVMNVLLLWHERALNGGCSDEKLIGAYATRARAEEALARFQTLPGFCDYPDGFTIVPYSTGQESLDRGICDHLIGIEPTAAVRIEAQRQSGSAVPAFPLRSNAGYDTPRSRATPACAPGCLPA